MGTVIKSSSICANGTHSAIELAVQAAEKCIEKSGILKNDINLLIYAGVYRDHNIAEPAIAPLIQKKLGLNLDPMQSGAVGTLTFSFDVINGVCGFLSAVTVAEAALKCGSARYALIVSGDAHPSKRFNADFPFSNVGSAILLAYSDDKEKGFKNFMFRTNGDEHLGISSKLNMSEFGTNGREYTSINVDKDYHEELHEMAVESIQKFIDEDRLDISDVDYLVTSQQYSGFGKKISDTIGLNGNSKVVDLHDTYGDPHTSSLPLSFHHICSGGDLKENNRILFVAAGSGLTAACALYVV
jgi:3-oxoacyl-[acyl-carrier-protein] synthase III